MGNVDERDGTRVQSRRRIEVLFFSLHNIWIPGSRSNPKAWLDKLPSIPSHVSRGDVVVVRLESSEVM